MSRLTEVSSSKHQHLKVKTNAQLVYAAQQHMLNLRVHELPQAVSSFPTFISKNEHDGNWALSALTSIVPGKNVFVVEEKWQSVFLPISIRTYPMYLMRSPKDEKAYTVGLVEQSEAFSETEGEPLFDGHGKATIFLTEQSKMLEASIKDDIHTHQFLQKVAQFNLLKSIDLIVHYAGGEAQVLQGLYTINEDTLQSLSAAQLDELNKLGYLPAIYAMLMSIYQLNNIVGKNNQFGGLDKIEQIKLESARDRSGG